MNSEQAARLLALARESRLLGPEASKWEERLLPLRTEISEAVRFLTGTGEPDAAVELAACLWRLWLSVGDVAGGRRMLAMALDGPRPEPTRSRALALYGDGLLAFRAGAMPESRARNEEALQVARDIRDQESESLALVGLSRVALRDGDYDRVCSLATQARELVRGLHAAADVSPLHLLAVGTRLSGDYDAAARLYSDSLRLNERLGDRRMVGMELFNLAHVELHRGNIPEAQRLFTESARICNRQDPYEEAMTHLGAAALALAERQNERAKELLERTRSTLEGAGIVLDPDDAFEVRWLQERLAPRAG